MLRYIEANYPSNISNSELAELVHLSSDRFSHLFRESVGMAPLQYINEVRLKKAMNLLKNGGYTAVQVADAVGFSDYNNFGRMFKRYYLSLIHIYQTMLKNNGANLSQGQRQLLAIARAAVADPPVPASYTHLLFVNQDVAEKEWKKAAALTEERFWRLPMDCLLYTSIPVDSYDRTDAAVMSIREEES